MPGKTLQTKLFKKPGLNRLKANRCGSASGDRHKNEEFDIIFSQDTMF